ncbi:hypothetical protein [Variovorax sp. WS11]|uniref:hypothetical protein n=1 Tax=Variovorax sp. WS11 TaxID=1105204 RepID=UPI0013DC7AB1|nr:hypothetical protein [Variovorax sp. WS11]NDZ13987.1 hypothetical protein [Variovorax sp. WS11]
MQKQVSFAYLPKAAIRVRRMVVAVLEFARGRSTTPILFRLMRTLHEKFRFGRCI